MIHNYFNNNTHMAKTLQDSSSKRHFYWTNKVGNQEEDHLVLPIPTLKSSLSNPPPPPADNNNDEEEQPKKQQPPHHHHNHHKVQLPRRKLQAAAISRLRSVLTAFGKNKSTSLPQGLGPRVIGTLFGSKKGHVHFALQRDPNSPPAFLVELATPISGLVREMASGLVRIALECDKQEKNKPPPPENNKLCTAAVVRRLLLEEPQWRTYCNGKKSGFASRRECGPKEWKVLKAVEPISMGAGVLPASSSGDEAEAEDEIMYMRAKFERVVGSRDSEAFYMMNPDSNGAPELSIYLLRV